MRNFLTALTAGHLAALLVLSAADAAPLLRVDPTSFGFSAVDTADYFLVGNNGDGTLTWNVTSNQSWLAVAPTSGSVPEHWNVQVWISLDRTGLADGTYTGELAVTSNGGSATVFVSMLVQNAPILNGGGGERTLSSGQTYERIPIWNTGVGILEWSAVTDEPWIDLVPPESGSLSYGQRHTIQINLDAGSLPSQDEEHVGHLTMDSNGGSALTTVRFVPPSQSPGLLGVYADVAGTNCNIVAPIVSLKQVHIVHTRTDGATASMFSAPKPACWTNAIYLSDVNVFPVTIGNSQTGTSVPYGVCKVSTSYVMAINYFVQGPPTQFCCEYPVLPDPHALSGRIEIADCGFNTVYGTGATAIVNPDVTCPCSLPPVAVEETTWGRVKALYAPR